MNNHNNCFALFIRRYAEWKHCVLLTAGLILSFVIADSILLMPVAHGSIKIKPFEVELDGGAPGAQVEVFLKDRRFSASNQPTVLEQPICRVTLPGSCTTAVELSFSYYGWPGRRVLENARYGGDIFSVEIRDRERLLATKNFGLSPIQAQGYSGKLLKLDLQ